MNKKKMIKVNDTVKVVKTTASWQKMLKNNLWKVEQIVNGNTAVITSGGLYYWIPIEALEVQNVES